MRKLAAALLLCGSLVRVSAGTYKIPGDQPVATITIPDEWKAKELGESVHCHSADGTLQLLVTPGEGAKIAETVGEVMRYIRGTGAITVRPDSAKNETGKLNGMNMRHMTWRGTDQKGDVKISFTIVFISDKKPLLFAYWGSPKAEKKYERALAKMLQGIQPT